MQGDGMTAGGDSEAPQPPRSPALWDPSSSVDADASSQKEGPPAGLAADMALSSGVVEVPAVLKKSRLCGPNILFAPVSLLNYSKYTIAASQRVDASAAGVAAATCASPEGKSRRPNHSPANATVGGPSERLTAKPPVDGTASTFSRVEDVSGERLNKGPITLAVRHASGGRAIGIVPSVHSPTLAHNSSTYYSAHHPSVSAESPSLASSLNHLSARSRSPSISNGGASSHEPQYNASVQASVVIKQSNHADEQREQQEHNQPSAYQPAQPPQQQQPQHPWKHQSKRWRHTTAAISTEAPPHKLRARIQWGHLFGTFAFRGKGEDLKGRERFKREQNGDYSKNRAGDKDCGTSKSGWTRNADIPLFYTMFSFFWERWRQTRRRCLTVLAFLLQAGVLFFCGFLCALRNTKHPKPNGGHSGHRQATSSVKNHFLNEHFPSEALLPHQNVSILLPLPTEPADIAPLPLRTAHTTPGGVAALTYDSYTSHVKMSQAEREPKQRSLEESPERRIENTTEMEPIEETLKPGALVAAGGRLTHVQQTVEMAAGVAGPTQLESEAVYRRAYSSLTRQTPSGTVHEDDEEEEVAAKLGWQTLSSSNTQPYGWPLPSVHCSHSTRQAFASEGLKAIGKSPAGVALIHDAAARRSAETGHRQELLSWRSSTHQGSHDVFSSHPSPMSPQSSVLLRQGTSTGTDSLEGRRLSFSRSNLADPASAAVHEGATDSLHKNHSSEIQSSSEEKKKEEQQLRQAHKRMHMQHQQGDGQRSGIHQLAENLDADGFEQRALRLSPLHVSSATERITPIKVQTASSAKPITGKTVHVLGAASVRVLQANQEKDKERGKQHPGALDAAELVGEAAKSEVSKERRNAGRSVSTAAGKAVASASLLEPSSTRNSEEVAPSNSEKGPPFLSKRHTKQNLPSGEKQRQLPDSLMGRVVQKAIAGLSETNERSPMTQHQQQQQVLKEQQVAERPRVSSIPELRKLLTELSIASRNRRRQAAEQNHATAGGGAIAVSFSMETGATSSPVNPSPLSPASSADEAALPHSTQRPTRFPRTEVVTSNFVRPPMATGASSQTRVASETGDGLPSVGIGDNEVVARRQREESREGQLWDMEGAEESEDAPEQQDGDDNVEEEQPDFIQQQEEEAARRAKMRRNFSVVPVLSTDYSGAGVAPRASHTNAFTGITPPRPAKLTVSESLETSVMKKMWETREHLSEFAKKKLRTFNSSATRRQVCNLMQSDQQQYKLWFTLASLFVIEWPFYSYSEGGGLHFLKELLEQTRSFAAPAGSSRAVQQRYESFRACKMPAALEDGLLTLMDCLPSGAELPAALAAASEHPVFAKLLRALGDVHVPLDNYHGLAHVFDIVEAAMGLAWGKNVFLGKTDHSNPSFKPFTAEELFDKYTYAFSESRRYFSTLLLLFRAMRQHVTQKPHTGIILLLVEQPETSHSKMDPFNRLQDFRVLQAQIRESVQMKLESALLRFYPSGRRSSSKEMVDLPDIRVSGFFARNGDGRTVEKGLVGVEVDFALIEKFKQETPRFGVMIQVNLLDTWADKNSPEAWPDVLEPYNNVLSAYTATQLLKTELLWDPSLASLAWGRTKFVYSSISEVFEYERVRDFSSHGRASAYDPDLHVMLLQSYKDFVMQGKEEGVMKHLINSLKRKPLGHARIPRNFDSDRITFQGSAMLLSQPPVRTTEDAVKERASQLSETSTPLSSTNSAPTAVKTRPVLESVPSGKRAPKEFPSRVARGKPEKLEVSGLPGTVARHLRGGEITETAVRGRRGKDASQEEGSLESQETREKPRLVKVGESTRSEGRRSTEAKSSDDGGGRQTAEKRQLYRKKQFGAGLNYGEVLQLERAIRENTIMLHIKIKGLGNTAAEEWQSLQAHEILNRLAQRLRCAFEIHYVEAVKKRPKPTGPPRPVRGKGFVPEWVLALSVCATASFFICCLVLLVHHKNVKLPWWLSCLCSRVPPWEKETGEHSASHPTSTSDDEDASVSPLPIPFTWEIRRRQENLSVFMGNISRRDEAPSAASAVAALAAIPENVTRLRGVGRSRKLTRPRYMKTSFQGRNTLKGRLASLGSGKEVVPRPGHSFGMPGTRNSMATSACSSDAAKPFDVAGVHAGDRLGHAGMRPQESGSFSHTLFDGTRGSELDGRAITVDLTASSRRSESFIPAPRLLSQEHPDTKTESRQQQHRCQQQHTEALRLRQQTEWEAIILAARCVTRVTRASRIVLENSLCSPPVSLVGNNTEVTSARRATVPVAASISKPRPKRSIYQHTIAL